MRKLALYITLILPLILFVSCGNVGIGPPEREIEKKYRRADEIYGGLVEGSINGSRRNWNNVIQQFSIIVEKYPGSGVADDAQCRVGLCYIQTHGLLEDSPQKAIAAFDYLLKHYPNSDLVDDASYWKAYSYSLMQDDKRALAEYENFARMYPQSEFHDECVQQVEKLRAKPGVKEKPRTKTTPVAEESAAKTPPPVVADKTEEIRPKKPAEKPKQKPDVKPEQKEKPPEEITTVPAEIPETEQRQDIPEMPEEPGELSYIENIRFNSGAEFTRIVVDLNKAVKYEVGRLEDPDRIYMDVQTAFISPAKQTIEVDDRFIKNIRAAQFDERSVRIVLDVKQVRSYDVFQLKDPDRIVMDLYDTDMPDKPDKPDDSGIVPPEITPSERSHPIPLVKQLGLKVKTIVIDPGHGGKDPGAVSKSGVYEKTIVLDVAKRLKKLLESKGSYRVYLTRETDVYIPLERRTAFANEKEADIFISLHANAHESRRARGVETYYLSLASDEEARATAALENASAEKGIKDLNNILRHILRGAKVEESRELARTVQSRLCQHTGSDDRGIRRAPFIVLIGAESPSILVEMGFMSNILDERLLCNSEYKDKIVRALMEAVEDYVQTINHAS